ncbi:dCTP deaminase [Pseudobutyrivibrio sp.]
MIYGDTIIRTMINDESILYTYEGALNPASINLRLGNTFLVIDQETDIYLGEEVHYKRYEVSNHEVIPIPPGGFMLATTIEKIAVPISCAAFVQGRSSIGRIGLTVQNAGFVDPGFHGHITLELKNDTQNYIYLKPYYPVAQLVYMEAGDVSHEYNGKYVGQVEATGSRMNEDIYKPGNQKDVN